MGAEVFEGGAHFRVWAPRCRTVEVVFETGVDSHPLDPLPLNGEGDGWFSAQAPESMAGIGVGIRYRYRLDGGDAFPDPASRFQPNGPFGPSEIIDPSAFPWSDADWRGLRLDGQVLYELHVGTFTPEGTWNAAARELPRLADLGVTVIEMMPVADFPGRFGWGYDGVNLFAPTRLYGRPDDLRRFVDRAHALGLGVILDVVWNHLGPSGNFLHPFSDHYFSRTYVGEWGEPFNFDGEQSGPVREFILANARYWIDEFHFDGLRIDATQSMFDASPRHIVAETVSHARQAGGDRSVLIIVENEPQDAWLVRPENDGGCGADAVWNDDFHHAARVALTGRREAYYLDYLGTPQEFVSIARSGFLYQGQHYRWQRKRRGTSTKGLHPRNFVCYLQNHDQIANSAYGRRLHQLTSPGRHRALTALLLLGPWTPLLFQGQEFGATTPFTYFADHDGELAAQVCEGRGDFLLQFQSIAAEHGRSPLSDPADVDRFRRTVLDWTERDRHAEAVDLHRDLIRLRATDPAFRSITPGSVQGAVVADRCFVLRFESDDGDRLLLVNLGAELHPQVLPEPLLAPPDERGWRLVWSSDSPRYGGRGTPEVETADGFRIPPETAVVLGAPSGSADTRETHQ